MKTEIISFYSDVDQTNYYSDCAAVLTKRLTELSVPHDIRSKESTGSYQKNCLSKPAFIHSLLSEKKRPVVWLDIDSVMLRSPKIFDHIDSTVDMVFACPDNNIMSAKASPIYFSYSNNALRFLEQWIDVSEKILTEGKWFDHESLISTIYSQLKKKVEFRCIGEEYCTWPGKQNAQTVIIMGLSNTESKILQLRSIGMSDAEIRVQTSGSFNAD